eukprot:SAG31_NODE_4294_length_3375_cov_2.010989_3_plen_285_part_00
MLCFRGSVEAFGKKLKPEEIRDRIAHFVGDQRILGKGNVEMDKRAVEVIFWILEDHSPGESNLGSATTADPGTTLRRIYFGRQVCEGGGKGLADQYNLKKRSHLGPTSMDAELSLLCANLGCARPGTLALDPFAGTGSLLLAGACLLRNAAQCDCSIGTTFSTADLGSQEKQINLQPRNAFRSNSFVLSFCSQRHTLVPPCGEPRSMRQAFVARQLDHMAKAFEPISLNIDYQLRRFLDPSSVSLLRVCRGSNSLKLAAGHCRFHAPPMVCCSAISQRGRNQQA